MSESTKTGIVLSKINSLREPEDWKAWRQQLDEWLTDNDYDLDAPVKPTAPAAGTIGKAQEEYATLHETYIAEEKKWVRKQLKGVNSIKSVCGPRAKRLIEECAVVDKAFEALEKEFKPSGDATLSMVYNKWADVCLAQCKDVPDFICKFNDIYDELEQLGFTENRYALVLKFLDGLGPAFGSFRMSFNMQYDVTQEAVTIAKVQGLARNEESRLARDSATALAAARTAQPVSNSYSSSMNDNNKRGRDDEDWWCDECGKPGHLADKCWRKHPELETEWRTTHPERAAMRDQRVQNKASRGRGGRGNSRGFRGYRGYRGRGGRGRGYSTPSVNFEDTKVTTF